MLDDLALDHAVELLEAHARTSSARPAPAPSRRSRRPLRRGRRARRRRTRSRIRSPDVPGAGRDDACPVRGEIDRPRAEPDPAAGGPAPGEDVHRDAHRGPALGDPAILREDPAHDSLLDVAVEVVELDGEHPSRARLLDANDLASTKTRNVGPSKRISSRSRSLSATGFSATIFAPPAETFTVWAVNGVHRFAAPPRPRNRPLREGTSSGPAAHVLRRRAGGVLARASFGG